MKNKMETKEMLAQLNACWASSRGGVWSLSPGKEPDIAAHS